MSLAAWTNQGWVPGPGDPSWVAWLAVGIYLVAAWLSWRAAVTEVNHRERTGVVRLPWLWLAVGLLMFVLAVNKQLDLHNAITHFGRRLAREGGWYRERRSVQLLFTAVGGLAGIALFVGAWWGVVRRHPRYLHAVAGASLLIGFILMRMASFHHFDQFLRSELLAGRLHSWIELVGGGWVALAAWRVTRGK